MLQVVGLELDAVQLLVSAKLLDFLLRGLLAQHHLALFVAGELVEEVLLRQSRAPFLLPAEILRNREHRHQRVAVHTVHLHLLCHLHRVGQRLGQVGKHRLHLLRTLQPLLLRVVQAVRVSVVLLRRQANQVVVSLAVLLLHKVGVVRRHQLDVVFPRQAYQLRLHLHLPAVGVVVRIRLVRLVAHQLDVVVVAEHPLEPQHRLLRTFQVALHDQLRNLAAQARRADNQTLVVLLQHLVVYPRAVVQTVRIRYRRQLAQRMVALKVLSQQYQVVAAAVHNALAPRLRTDLLQVLVLVVETTPRAVSLRAHNRLENLLLQPLQLLLQLAQLFTHHSSLITHHFLDSGLQLLDLVLHLPVLLVHRVKEILDAEHVPVVRQRHRVHTATLRLRHQVGNLRHTVQHRIVRVHMQMSKLRHKQIFFFECKNTENFRHREKKISTPPLTTHHSSLLTHHSSLITHHSSLPQRGVKSGPSYILPIYFSYTSYIGDIRSI